MADKSGPKTANDFFNRGDDYANQGEYDHAIKDYSQAIEFDLEYAEAFNGRGLAYAGKGKYDLAIEDYNRAIIINSRYADAFNNRSLAYAAIGDYDVAIEDCTRVIKLNPQNANAFSNRGFAYIGKDDYDCAIEDYDRAIELDPQNAMAFNNRGLAYVEKGDYDRAIKDYDRAIKDYDRAIEDYDQAIKIDLQNTDAFFNRGSAYFSKGDYSRAIEDYDQAIKLDPQHKNAIYSRLAATDLLQTATGQKEIKKKYEAQLKQQQKKFEEQLKNYKSDVLEIEKYKKREQDYKIKMIITVIVRWLLLIVLLGCGATSYGLFIYLYPDLITGLNTNPWTLFRFFPLVIFITIVLSPLVWMIRWLGDDRNRLWALREDAYTCGILTQFVNEPQANKVKLELILKLFKYHDQSSTAELIANWGKSLPSGINPSDSVKLRDVAEIVKQQKSE